MGIEHSYYDRLPKQYYYDAAKNDYQIHTTIIDDWGNRRVNVVHFGATPPPGFPATGLVGHYPGYMGPRGPDYTTTRTVQTLRPVNTNVYEVPTNVPVYTKTRTVDKTIRPVSTVVPQQPKVEQSPVDTSNDEEIARRLQQQFDEETSLYSLRAKPPVAVVEQPAPVQAPLYASIPIQPLPPVYASHLNQQTPGWMLDPQYQLQVSQPPPQQTAFVEQPRISPLDPPAYSATMKPPPAYQPIKAVSSLNPPEYKPQISPLYSQPLGSISHAPQLVVQPQADQNTLTQIQKDKLEFLKRQEMEKAEREIMERERQRIKESSIQQAQLEEEQRHRAEQLRLQQLEQQQILEKEILERRKRQEVEQQKLQNAIEERRRQEEEIEKQRKKQAYELEQQRIKEMSKQVAEEAQVEQNAMIQRIPTSRNQSTPQASPVAVVHNEPTNERRFNLLGFAEPSVKGFDAHDDL